MEQGGKRGGARLKLGGGGKGKKRRGGGKRGNAAGGKRRGGGGKGKGDFTTSCIFNFKLINL